MQGNYNRDVWIARIRRRIKPWIPASILRARSKRKDQDRQSAMYHILTEREYPWLSPNIWEAIVSHYSQIERPVVFEYGTGASTIWHFETIARLGGGSYTGIEIDPNWFWIVATALIKSANGIFDKTKIEVNRISPDQDTDVLVRAGEVTVNLRLRTTTQSYVNGLDHDTDVVVIDGAHRKECVRKVLATQYLRPGGLLMLMEAGRGSPLWWEGMLSGENDYSEEVDQLLALGGELLDGNGVDRWEGAKRKSPPPASYYCPMEACKLIISISGDIDRI